MLLVHGFGAFGEHFRYNIKVRPSLPITPHSSPMTPLTPLIREPPLQHRGAPLTTSHPSLVTPQRSPVTLQVEVEPALRDP